MLQNRPQCSLTEENSLSIFDQRTSTSSCFSYYKPFLSYSSMQCDSIVKDRRCRNKAKYVSWMGNYCHAHTPEIIKRIESIKQRILESDISIEWHTKSKYIISTYKELRPFRLTPPPEIWASVFLSVLQSNRCYICSSETSLVEDHCHETGMVRAKLCKSCNTKEAVSDESYWDDYRKFAPANGWHYRYFGLGQQFEPGSPDPINDRLSKDILDIKMAEYFNLPKADTDDLLEILETLTPLELINMYSEITTYFR